MKHRFDFDHISILICMTQKQIAINEIKTVFYKKQFSIKKGADSPYLLDQLKNNPLINKDMLSRGSVQTFLRCQA